jgi:regulator of sigma E protease
MTVGMLHMFKTKNGASIGGPIHIINSMAQDAKKGFRPFIVLMILISLNLAILNLIPVPIFDGGQIVLTSIESLIGKELPHKLRLIISYACWVLVLGLFIYLSINDIYRLFLIKLIKVISK